jgi:predicted TIM-barrel fold metal-dependent hydrolase
VPDALKSAASRSSEIRAQLSHPVIDGDGHWLEPLPVLLDYLRDAGGAKAVDSFMANREQRTSEWYGITEAERNAQRVPRPIWWGMPADTLDRATVAMPALLRERLDSFGIDFALMYPTAGLMAASFPDPDFRRAFCRAVNVMSADMFADQSDRMTPVAVIPSYTPEEALDEITFVTTELGAKAALINGTLRRTVPAFDTRPLRPGVASYIDNLVLDPVYDYDPVWQKFAQCGLAVTTHAGSVGWMDRRSTTNFTFNHIGHFAQSNHTFARALFLSGVTARFPELNFAFLEGGVGWAASLFADLVGHWKKRSRGPLLKNLRPSNLDLAELRRLYEDYGGTWLSGRIDEQLANLDLFCPGADVVTLTEQEEAIEPFDDFAAARIETVEDIRARFSENFYFGCEADDPLTGWAFDPRLDARLKPVFSSDIAHFDVVDMTEVLEEAFELVDDGVLDEAQFRAFTFDNAVALHSRSNRDFFAGTVVEPAVVSSPFPR